jgi:hypothetical protein
MQDDGPVSVARKRQPPARGLSGNRPGGETGESVLRIIMSTGKSSACREFVTAPADRSGGVVAHLFTLIPDPARPVSKSLAGYSNS